MNEESLLRPYRMRTVRVGVWATAYAVVILVAFPHIPGAAIYHHGLYNFMLVGAGLGGAVAALTPWNKVFDAGWGLRFFYAWSVTDIILVSIGVAATGGLASPLFVLYVLTTVFFAAVAYPPIAQGVLLLFTYAAYLFASTFSTWSGHQALLFVRMAILAVSAFMASRLSRELVSHMSGHGRARQEADRRADLLAAVTKAGRAMSTLDSDSVLSSVVDAAIELDFDGASLDVFDDEDTYRVLFARGLPITYSAGSRHAATLGMPGLVRTDRRTVIVDDYGQYPAAIGVIREDGFRSAIGTPVWVGGEIVAVLAAGSRSSVTISQSEAEAFELLAAQAGRALENAQRFEAESATVARLAELDRLKRDFVATVSHELRTPLTAIIGMGQTLQDRWSGLSPAQRADFIDRIVANAASLEDIITTLLDFSQMEEGRMEVRPEPIEVRDVFDSTSKRLSSLFSEHPLYVEVFEPLAVRADAVLIERVLDNLLSNAVKYTPPGTPVTLSARREGDAVRIAVTDLGPGIAEADLAHLGERFFRGGEYTTRTTRGTGLGLAIVREVLRLHGTVLEIKTSPGEGAQFSFSMPAVAIRASGAPIEIGAPAKPRLVG